MKKEKNIDLTNIFEDDEPKVSSKDKALSRYAEMMIKKIEALQSDWRKPWYTEAPTRMPINFDGRLYNGMNALMLLFYCEEQGYKHPIFVTYDKVMSLNYNGKRGDDNRTRQTNKQGEELPFVTVRKGEKSFPVFLHTFKVLHKDTKQKISYTEYQQMSDEEKKDYNVYPNQTVYNVFNIVQTNLEEARPELYKKLTAPDLKGKSNKPCKQDELFSFPALDDMLDTQGWYCPIEVKHQDKACYVPSCDKIVLPEKSQFNTGEAFYSTAIHEMTHSTGHADRLNREGITKMNGFGSERYGKEELIAEMTAAIVCHSYGFDNGIQEESAAYLKSWLKNIKQDPSFLKDVLNDVRRAYTMISNRIDKIA